MKITNAIVGRSCDQHVAIGSNHCNTRVYLLAAEKALAPHSRSSRRWRYTLGVHHVREIRRYFCQRNFSALRQPACVQHDILGSGLVHWSVPGLHKILVHEQ